MKKWEKSMNNQGNKNKFHNHDCECCHYLGSESTAKDNMDYYVCEQGGAIPTVIARFGDDGDYYSGIYAVKELARNFIKNNPQENLNLAQAVLMIRNSGVAEFSKELVEATARAVLKGLLDDDLKFVPQPKDLSQNKKTKLKM